MNHQHVSDRLSEYVDGVLTAQQRDRVDTHLAECAECAAELAYLRRIQSLLSSRPASRSPGLWDGVQEGLLSEQSVTVWGQFEWVGKRVAPLLAAAAVVAVAFFGGLTGNGAAVSLEDYLTSAWSDESPEVLMVSDAEISMEDAFALATSDEGRR